MLDRAFVGPGDQTGRPYIADHITPDQVEAWAAAMLEGTEKDAGVKKRKPDHSRVAGIRAGLCRDAAG